MLASTRRISLCIFCISGSTPDSDTSAGNDKIESNQSPYKLRTTTQHKTNALRQQHHELNLRASEASMFRTRAGGRTSGEHLVDVLEGARLVHFRRRDLPPAQSRCKDLGRSKDLEGEGVRRGRAGRTQGAGCRSRAR
jgi:hypothetical protein